VTNLSKEQLYRLAYFILSYLALSIMVSDPVFCKLWDISLPNSMHHSSLRPLRVKAGSAVFAAIPICPVPESMRFSSMYCSQYWVLTRHI